MYDYSGSIHLYFDAKENTKLNERVDAFCLLLKENNNRTSSQRYLIEIQMQITKKLN